MNKSVGFSEHILIVDDDHEFRDELSEYLSSHEYLVGTANSGNTMRVRLDEKRYDLALVDLSLPGDDGLSLMKYLHDNHQIPVIMMTGKGDVIDRVIGLELGAEDYLAKPFEPRELLARMRSVLRRMTRVPALGSGSERNIIVFDRWRLDLSSRELLTATGDDMPLTTAEFKLLEVFVTHPKRVLTRNVLLDNVYGTEWAAYDRSIDNLVFRLRRKIESVSGEPKLIKSVRGVGYLFTADIERASNSFLAQNST